MKIKTLLVTLAAATLAAGCTVTPRQDRPEIVGKGPFAYHGKYDLTPDGLRRNFYRATGAQLGACIEKGSRNDFSNGYGSNLRRRTCVAWPVTHPNGEWKVGDIYRLPRKAHVDDK